ncbi:MAG: diguanylate cyclase [Lachnospiraceae bacterium]|nr:diguanylate cyclase [Lachnospiraceae bacterium]
MTPGDKLLIKAASLLKTYFGDCEIYRAGGDEFVILCPDITEVEMEKRLLKIRSLSEETEDVSFAFGTAFCEEHHDIRRAIRSADERMYKDKEAYYLNHPEKDRRARKRI